MTVAPITMQVRARWAALMLVVMFVVLGLANVAYTNHVQAQARHRADQQQLQSDQRWCALMIRLDNTVTNPDLKREVHDLRLDLHCP